MDQTKPVDNVKSEKKFLNKGESSFGWEQLDQSLVPKWEVQHPLAGPNEFFSWKQKIKHEEK